MGNGYETVDCNSYIDVAIDQCSNVASPMLHYGNNYGGYMIFYQEQTPIDGITDGINVCVARGDTEYIRAQANCCRLEEEMSRKIRRKFMKKGGPNNGESPY